MVLRTHDTSRRCALGLRWAAAGPPGAAGAGCVIRARLLGSQAASCSRTAPSSPGLCLRFRSTFLWSCFLSAESPDPRSVRACLRRSSQWGLPGGGGGPSFPPPGPALSGPRARAELKAPVPSSTAGILTKTTSKKQNKPTHTLGDEGFVKVLLGSYFSIILPINAVFAVGI